MIKGIRAKEFICKCDKCKSENTSFGIATVFKHGEYYGTKITIKCLECGSEFSEIY